MKCETADQVKNACMYAKVPLIGNFQNDFIYKAELCDRAVFFVDGNSQVFRVSDSGSEISLTEISRTSPMVSFSAFRENPEKFVSPKISRVSEISRNANLGFLGWLLGLKHTTVALAPVHGPVLLLEKTADMGVWLRRPGWFERLTIGNHVDFVDGEPLSSVYGKFAEKADFDRVMKSSYTCQHFTRDCLRALVPDAPPRPLLNQWLFDRVGNFFNHVDRSTQDLWLRYFKSAACQGRMHELLCSWRCRLALECLDEFS
jgi:hypothetical protein